MDNSKDYIIEPEKINRDRSDKNKILYSIDLPYPDIKVNQTIRDYARLLLDDFTGHTSELTTILQYVYGSVNLADRAPDVAEALQNIAIVEMRHLKMLAGTVKQLGVDPQYRVITQRNTVNNWTPEYIIYNTSRISRVILDSIDGEYKSIEQYQRHIKLINDDGLKELLKRIIMDEELHIKIFKDLYQKYVKQ